MSPAPADYVDVAERIRQFYERYPEGSLQMWSQPELMMVGDKTYIRYIAAAYRTPDDKCPAHGVAWEPVPGPTPFTKDSELQNAETSAWGRAIVALGFETKHIASKSDVENRQEASQQPKPATEKMADPGLMEEIGLRAQLLQDAYPEAATPGKTWKQTAWVYAGEKLGLTPGGRFTAKQANDLREWLEEQFRQLEMADQVPSEADPAPGIPESAFVAPDVPLGD